MPHLEVPPLLVTGQASAGVAFLTHVIGHIAPDVFLLEGLVIEVVKELLHTADEGQHLVAAPLVLRERDELGGWLEEGMPQ